MKRTQIRPYNYPGQGETKSADASARLPRGYRAHEERILIGSGKYRWEYAWKQTLTWGIQRATGYTVQLVHPETRPGASSAPEAAQPNPAHICQGMDVVLHRRFGPLPMKMPVRVVYTIDEPFRKGFAFGTLKGHPVSGEAAFIVERDHDGSVWFTLRSISGPGNGLWLLAYPVVLVLRTGLRNSYIHALARQGETSLPGRG